MFAKIAGLVIPSGKENVIHAANGIPWLKKKQKKALPKGISAGKDGLELEISSLKGKVAQISRLNTGLIELDRVCGGWFSRRISHPDWWRPWNWKINHFASGLRFYGQ